MATISWGKPRIFIAPTGAKMFEADETMAAGTNNANVVWELLSTPVEDSTNLTGTQGDKTEATIEGGEAEATKFAAATFELAMNVRMALDTGDVYRYLPDCMYEKIGGTGTDKDDPNHDKYVTTNVAVLLIPESPKAPAFYCPDCSVSIMETYTAADGAMWEITLAPNASTTEKAVQFGQYHVSEQTVSGKKKYMAKRGLAAS
jgi:hypothetical protein